MRITSTEKGTVHAKTWTRPYTTTYTQPITRYLIAWLYHHIWERISWRVWRKLERFQRKSLSLDEFDIPFTNRQDLTCYYLTNKNRIVIDTAYGEKSDTNQKDENGRAKHPPVL